MTSVHVIKPGMFTTVQDRGRWGFQAFGVPVGGAMDPFSFGAANVLVGNARTAAALEITITGPELEFESERLVAVAGADFALSVDGRAVSGGSAFPVPAGSRLCFGARHAGARAYLAVAGGFATPLSLGSRATHSRTGMGGLDGRALRAGDRLPLGDARSDPPRRAPVPRATVAGAGGYATVRILPGPHDDRFARRALETLQSAPYRVGSRSDRMGFRLEGPRLAHARGADILSDATPLGALQVPADGQPILLMADRQTTGGYPQIATVISADIGVAAQLAPGDALSFSASTRDEAVRALIARERQLMALES